MFSLRVIGVLLCFAVAGITAANAATITFDTLDSTSVQIIPTPTFSEAGFTVELSLISGSSAGPAIFDTTCSGYGGGDGCNGDADLVPGSMTAPGNQGQDGIEGNILIAHNSSLGTVPNDQASQNTIAMKLTALPTGTVQFIDASAVDDGDFTFELWRDGSLLQALGMIGLTADNQTGKLSTSSTYSGLSVALLVNDEIRINYSGSGGTDSYEFLISGNANEVPLPAALPLFLSALGGLGLFGWRSRKSA